MTLMMDRIGIVLKVVTAEVFQVTVVVEDVMEPLGIGILDMAEPTHTLWVEIIPIRVILAEVEWYRSHGHKYK